MFFIGDEVEVTIEKESRDWGYNPCPDGTKATVVGFSEMAYGRTNGYKRPGFHTNDSWAKLILEGGKEHIEFSGRLSIPGQTNEEKKRRLQVYRERTEDPNWSFLRDLPETPFWEGDFVKVNYPSLPNTVQITRVDYERIQSKRNDGSPYPMYSISDSLTAGWTMDFSANDMELVERGPVWKYYHGEKIIFNSVKEEAELFTMLGRVKEVKNPTSNLYIWTLEEVLKAIKDGIVHGFTMPSGLFGGKPRISAQFFIDGDLGRKVASETLKGFEK